MSSLRNRSGCQGGCFAGAIALVEVDAVETVKPYLDHPESEVRLGAMAGLLRYGGITGVLVAGEQLTALENSPHPAQRAFMARVIGQVGVQNFYYPLLSLLNDEDHTVRQTALIAADRVNPPFADADY